MTTVVAMTAGHTEDTILDSLLRIRPDVLFTALSGLASVAIVWLRYRNPTAREIAYFTSTNDHYDVTSVCAYIIFLIGAVNIAVATLRLRGFCKLNFNKYVTALVVSLLANFCLGMVLTDHRGRIPETLEDQMRTRLKESLFAQARLGVSFAQGDAWDFIQTKMHCCGIENYQEYFSSKANAKDQAIPMSCCVMRPVDDGDDPVVANPSQCTLDAARGVRESIFLHVQGCHGPLSRWLVRHVSTMTANLFCAIVLQAIAILFLSWQGYHGSKTFSRDR